MNKRIDNFFAGVLVFLLLPLLPLGLEHVINGRINVSTLFLATAIYSITIGLTSSLKSFFILSIFLCFIFSALYGMSIDPTKVFDGAFEWCITSIIIIFLISLSERYRYNYLKNNPAFSFE